MSSELGSHSGRKQYWRQVIQPERREQTEGAESYLLLTIRLPIDQVQWLMGDGSVAPGLRAAEVLADAYQKAVAHPQPTPSAQDLAMNDSDLFTTTFSGERWAGPVGARYRVAPQEKTHDHSPPAPENPTRFDWRQLRIQDEGKNP